MELTLTESETELSPADETPTEAPLPASSPANPEPVRRADHSVDWTATRGKYMAAFVDQPRDPLTAIPAWQAHYNQLWATEQEKHVLERMQAIDHAANVFEAPRPPNIPLTEIGAWAGSSQSDAALVVDRALALESPCTRLEIGDGQYLYYSRGMSGALTGSQVDEFCLGGFEDQIATTDQRARLVALVEAAPQCRIETMATAGPNRLGEYFSCLGRELRKKGVDP